MALTADQTTLFYEVIGFPESPEAVISFQQALNRFFYSGITAAPAWYNQDLTGLQGEIASKLSALTASQESRLITFLDEFEAISTSPLIIESGGGAGGTLTDHPRKRGLLRIRIANLTAISVPSGGFQADYQRLYDSIMMNGDR